MDEEALGEMAGIMGCGIGEWPIPYLGLQVGGRIKGCEAWRGTVERVRRRLKSWDVKHVSLGGRLTLVKSVLTSISIYNLLFLKIPRTIEIKLRALFTQFLWGIKKERRRRHGLVGKMFANL